MTEADAVTKWCPMTNRSYVCVASKCMAWRWEPLWEYHPMTGGGYTRKQRKNELSPTEGYCGLANLPYTNAPEA